LFLNWLADSKRSFGALNGAGPGCCISISLSRLEIDQSGQTAIANSALHKCDGSATSTAMAAPCLVFDRDRGIAQGDQAEGQRAAQAADAGAERHDGKEHTGMPLYPSKLVYLSSSSQARPAAMPSTAPPSVPNSRPSKASNTIFIRSTLVTDGPEWGL
jgi:hypothetical protein